MTDHDLVLYGNDAAALTHCVVPFLATAVQDHGAAVVIAGVEHERAFRSALAAVAVDTESPAVRDRMIFLNASEIVKGLIVGGQVDRARFERLIGSVIRKLRRRYVVHAYGEIVGMLYSMNKPDAAARLEEFWKELVSEEHFRLMCGYPVEFLGPEFPADAMEFVRSAHTTFTSALRTLAVDYRSHGGVQRQERL